MRAGLLYFPQAQDLKRAYAVLQLGSEPIEDSKLALFSQWARLDARLAEIWVSYVAKHWKEIHPAALHEALTPQPWPSATAVLMEFAQHAVMMGSGNKSLFQKWKEAVTEGFPKADWELFFIAQRKVGGVPMLEDSRFSLSEYKKWGYLSREILVSKQLVPAGRLNPKTHSIDPRTRIEILKALLERRPRLTTTDYWDSIGRVVSRRQAERDLESSGLVKGMGQTQARFWRKK